MNISLCSTITMMRNRIRQHFPATHITTRNVSDIYVADFSERTRKVRGIEVHNTLPTCPNNPDKSMDCVTILNPTSIDIDFNIFDDHQFKDSQGKDLRHCECCIFPTINHDKSWVTMLEIKDCKPKNISSYKDDVVEQIVNTTRIFRNKNIITTHKIYGVVSFPRSKVSFNNTIFGMPPEYKKLKKEHKILFAATNKIEIVDNSRIRYSE